jgi:ADP-ribose pyrophosphatase YjhB (NUDIX family)
MLGEQKYVYIGVDPVILDWDRKIILALRSKSLKAEPGKWHLPGGLAVAGERMETAVKRIAKTKTGLDIGFLINDSMVASFVGFYDDPKRDSRYHDVAHSFLCKIIGGEKSAGKDITEVRAFTPSEIDGLDIAFDHRSIIKDAVFRLKALRLL